MSEPPPKVNDLSSETVTKLVSILVAIVVFAVVLVPIVNGLADGDGDGGGEGGDTEGYVVINNLQDFYDGANVTFTYKSYQIYTTYSEERYGFSNVLPEGYSLTLNMDTLNEYEDNISVPTGYCSMQNISILAVGGRDYSTFTEFPTLRIDWDTLGGIEIVVWDENRHTTTIDSVTAFTLTITDTHIYWTITSTWDDSTDPATYSADYDLTDTVEYEISYPSNDDVGWIPSMCAISLSTSPYTSFYSYAETMEGGIVTITCRFQLEINGNEGEGGTTVAIPVENISANNTITGRVSGAMMLWDDDNGYYGTALLEYEIHLIPTTDGKYKLFDTNYGTSEDVWSLVSVTNTMDEMGDPITIEVTNAELSHAGNYDFFTMYSSVNVNPLTYGGENGNGGSGSSTDFAGISGTAGTILKLIPVLVGVGVILAIVALFYDPRNLIKKD